MTEIEPADERGAWAKAPLIGVIIALVGLADAVYLTIKHYTDGVVPCSITDGCEKVLTSSYAEFLGVPIAALGAAGYFVAFSMALFTLNGNRASWRVFGVIASLMALTSLGLVAIQAWVLEAFCQFCLLSAATSIGLFLTYLFSGHKGGASSN